MKFTWFNLMPWPYLPDDFREKNRSVWVDIDSSLFDPVKSHEVYNTYMDLLEYASTLGFDGIGVNEHHQNGYGIMPSPNIIAAGLARRTKDVGLVVLGNSIALYNPPIRVAEEVSLRHLNIWPRPIQSPPPIHIPGGGSVETYDFCIDNTYSYSYLSFSGYLRAKALMDGYWRRVEERGAPDNSPYRAGFAQTILVAETDEEARRL